MVGAPGNVVAAFGDVGADAVEVDLGGSRYRAEVTATTDPPPRLLTCHSSANEAPRRFVVGEIDRIAGS